MNGVLTLNVKCKGGSCSCNQDGTITVRKDPNPPSVTGFVAYVHSGKEQFTLKGTLSDGDTLGDGHDIKNVDEVSVYYWDQGHDNSDAKPLILEVDIGGNEKKYYIKYESNEQEVHDKDAKIWVHHGISETSLQIRLDDRNCARNKVIPFDIGDTQKVFSFDSNASKGKGIQFVKSTTLSGSEYMVTSYTFSGDSEFKLSRVDYDKRKITEIDPPISALDGVRLYSNTSISDVPIVLELAEVGGGNSKFYASKDKDSWQQVDGESKGFYYGSKEFNEKQPTEALTNKLDEVICTHHNAVTMNITKNYSEQLSRKSPNGTRYCCSKKHNRVSVEEIPVSCVHHPSSNLTAYKHSVPNGKLAGIKFYLNGDQGQRRRITSRNLGLPMAAPVDVYVFYCGPNPALVYLNKGQSGSMGWFRKSRTSTTKKWTPVSILKDLTPDTITDCKTWNKLVSVLNQLHCTTLGRCPRQDSPARSDEGTGSGEDEDIPLGSSEVEDDSYKVLGTNAGDGLQAAVAPQGVSAISPPQPYEKEKEPAETVYEPEGFKSEKVQKKLTDDNHGTSVDRIDARVGHDGDESFPLGQELQVELETAKVQMYLDQSAGTPSGQDTIFQDEEGPTEGGTHLVTPLGDIIKRALSEVNNAVNDEKIFNDLADIGKAGSGLASQLGIEVINTAYHLVKDLASASIDNKPNVDPKTTGVGVPEAEHKSKEESLENDEHQGPTAKSVGDFGVPTGPPGEQGAPKKAQQPGQADARVNNGVGVVDKDADTPSPSQPGATRSQAPTPIAPAAQEALAPSGGGGSSPTNPGIAIGVPTGILTASGSLTGFGWWMFKRSKGDPWTIQGLTDATIVGFILIIGAKKQNAGDTDVPLIPMAGGIVELLDPEEHCIRAVWCDPSLPSHVEADFVKILILRIIGHAFDYGYPGSSTPQKFKHVSISNTLGIMFPKSCYSFLINGLKFGKHFETGASGGSHEDSVSNPCRCFKLANLCDSQLFWGISESRLRNTFNNVKSQVPTMPSQETLKAIQCLSA